MNNDNINDNALIESDLENVTGGNAVTDGLKVLGKAALKALEWTAQKVNQVGELLER